jgi:tetratricopeptide (TPR) repeat protein
MKYVFTYFFLLALTTLKAQSIFTRVHENLLAQKSLTILDSCAFTGFHKDSVLYYKGMIALKNNNLQLAKAISKDLQKYYPAFNEVHYLNGLLFVSMKNYARGINEFTQAIEKNPGNIKAYYNRSLAFGLMEEYEKAIEDLNKCIELKPMYSLAYYSRAYWNEFLGNYPAAIKDYENTVNIDPKNYDAYLGLAYIYQSMKVSEKSCEVINRAIQAGSQIAEELKDNFCR